MVARMGSRIGRVLSALVVLTFYHIACAGDAESDAPSPDGASVRSGLASKYPGDVGIERDTRVVFMEQFEEDSMESLWNRWESVGDRTGQSFDTDVPPGSSGRQSLLMERTFGSGAKLYRRLKNKEGGWGFDRLFARYYLKIASDCGDIHHMGTCIGGNLPATPWPVVKAGVPTDGAKSFWSGIETCGSSWRWDYYTYWCEMRASPPKGQTWGNSFIWDPGLKVERGGWICVEHMLKVNDPADSNGEQALWIDGRLVSHLGKAFPKGLWQYDKFQPGKGGDGIRWDADKKSPAHFTTPEGGAPFEGFRWRTNPELNINFLWLYIYTEKPNGHSIKIWFDHVVVATEYIGPIRPR